MRINLIISTFLVLLFGCNEGKHETKFKLNCIEDEEVQYLDAIQESLNKFVDANFEGSKENFLRRLEQGIFFNYEYKFEKSDSILISKLLTENFIGYYFKYKIKDSQKVWYSLQNNSLIDCFATFKEESKFVYSYLELKNQVGDLSPSWLASALLNQKVSKNYEQKIYDYIISIELYYFILENEFTY